MKVGDSRHATLLTIVALGAVGFVIIQVLPANSGKASASGESQVSGAGSLDQGQPVSSSLMTDPFSHASLAVDRAKEVADAANAKRLATEREVRAAEGGVAPWDASQFMSGPLPGASLRPDATPVPVKNTGPNRQLDQAPEVVIELQAVLEVKDRAAFLAVNGEEARTFRQGQTIAEGIRLKRIFEDGIVVSSGNKSFRIPIGGTQKL